MPEPPIVRITRRRKLLDLFNHGGYAARVQSGRLLEVIIDSRPPSMLSEGETEGTLSQRAEYRTPHGRTVAIVHRYLLPDSALGAPGPNAVLDRDRRLYRKVEYILDPTEG